MVSGTVHTHTQPWELSGDDLCIALCILPTDVSIISHRKKMNDAADAVALEMAAEADEDANARRALLMDESNLDAVADDSLSSDSGEWIVKAGLPVMPYGT